MIEKSLNVAGRTMTIETGKMAKQANGSVVMKYGETVVLVTATVKKKAGEDRGFFPLSVDYREKYYAAGKIPGGFFKREARPSEGEIIASRLTDRPIRPLFQNDFRNEVQILINVLSYDGENEADVLGTIGASVALSISEIPWNGPVASVRVGRVEDKFIINPLKSQIENSEMEIIISGTEDSIVMVEGEADFISEENLLAAIQYGHEAIKDIIKLQKELIKEIGKEKMEVPEKEVNQELLDEVDKLIKGKIEPLNAPKEKMQRYEDIDDFTQDIINQLEEKYPEEEKKIRSRVDDTITEDLRKKTLGGVRADGRGLKDIRDITIDTSVLPRTHGSSLFTRGETQAICVATLGGKKDEQMLDNLEGVSYKRYMLHYNFPPFSVGEVAMRFGTSRREVGHGNLAERAIKRILPDHDDFPYTIRVVSEILESNGSSSMATVCGGVMALLDAGVPIKNPVAGVAMGLIMENENEYAILTDILGTEDHLGDMDFKVAGTKDGITAIQMDLKIEGLPVDIMRKALAQANEARLAIIDNMNDTLSEPRKELSQYAPKILQTQIPVDLIGVLIGPGGKNIKKLIEDYGCEISVEEDGKVLLYGTDKESLEELKSQIDKYSLVPEAGEAYDGVIEKVMDFGAFVGITPTVSGLIHISELKWERVNKVEDVVKAGDKVRVKLLKKDEMGRYNFSLKALEPKPDNFSDSKPRDTRRDRGGRPSRKDGFRK